MLIAVLNSLELPPQVYSLADGIELRLDLFETLSFEALEKFMETVTKPIIFTLRSTVQGGKYSQSEVTRLDLIEKLCTLQPTFFDLETTVDKKFLQKIGLQYPQIKLIGSIHDFAATPTDLERLFSEIKHPCFFSYKIAAMANSSIDALRMLAFVKEKNQQGYRLTGVAMGEFGQFSRILGPVVGNFMDYAAPDVQHIQAPGQLTLIDLCNIYYYFRLNSSTAIYALIGDPVNQSLGHFVHNIAFERQGICGVYIKIRLKIEEIKEFLELARKLNFKGLSITMPLKEAMASFVSFDDSYDAQLKAVNTVLIEDGKFYGTNTDGEGALRALGFVGSKRVILLGAGGAARAVAYALKKAGAKLVILNRTAEKAISLAQELGMEGGSLDLLNQEYVKGYDILINATPVAMPIDPSWIIPKATLMDINVVEKPDSLLARGRQQGAFCIEGIKMFSYQAALQQKLWAKNRFIEDVEELITNTANNSLSIIQRSINE